LSVQNGQLMLKSDKLEFERSAAAKAEGDNRDNGKENRHHDRGRYSRLVEITSLSAALWNFE
jgi:hypothetical protein